MNIARSSRLEAEMLGRLAESLASVGVVGNENDRRFGAEDLPTSREALQTRFQEAGYTGGRLAVEMLVSPHDDVDMLIYDTDRYANRAEAEHAWERDYQKRWHDRIEHRVEDWIERLCTLRSQMADWLQVPEFEDMKIVERPPARMSEDLMQRFGVPPRDMPVFEIQASGRRVMRFQPKGLWIIGANGRVDLITRAAAPILVDQSEPLSRPSNWQLFDPGDRKRSVPLNQQTFSDLVRAGLQ